MKEIQTIKASSSILDRTLDNLAWGWRKIYKKSNHQEVDFSPDLPAKSQEKIKDLMHECLNPGVGEVSARARAAELGSIYLQLNDKGRHRFLSLVAQEFNFDESKLEASMTSYLEGTDLFEREQTLSTIRSILRPPWLQLFTKFNVLPNGVKFLVDMRADLLKYSRKDLKLIALDNDLKRLLISWFDIGFLNLKRLTWNEPAALLEKLIAYEAVHEIRSWDDLKHRLDSDRRCYAFFHLKMPEEPLIFVQVALVNDISDNIQRLLDENQPMIDPETADSAVFYSISNTQRGLRGISLGDFLIKRVVSSLSRQLPNIKTFATLSPIPGFSDFVVDHLESENSYLLTDGEVAGIKALFLENVEGSAIDSKALEKYKTALMGLCAHYLLHEKTGRYAKNKVAHFHLSNGAIVQRINWLADESSKGVKDSLGLMVNYKYNLDDIDKNHEAYIEQGHIATSSTLKTTS